MNKGKIEQIAAPQDLYQRPATEYVATFIGLTNRLSGASNGEEAVVFGQRIPLLSGSTKGDSVAVLVRPENLTLTPAGDNDSHVGERAQVIVDGIEETEDGAELIGHAWFQAPDSDGAVHLDASEASVGDILTVEFTDSFCYELIGHVVE